MSLISAAVLKQDHLKNLDGTEEDTHLASLIAAVGSVFAEHCNFHLFNAAAPSMESASYTIYLAGNPRNRAVLLLPIYPVTAVASVYADPLRQYAAGTLRAAGDYELVDQSELWVTTSGSLGAWPTAPRSVKVACTAGLTAIPDSLRLAAGLQIAHWYTNQELVGKISLGVEATTASARALGLLPEVRQLLQRFVLPLGWVG